MLNVLTGFVELNLELHKDNIISFPTKAKKSMHDDQYSYTPYVLEKIDAFSAKSHQLIFL